MPRSTDQQSAQVPGGILPFSGLSTTGFDQRAAHVSSAANNQSFCLFSSYACVNCLYMHQPNRSTYSSCSPIIPSTLPVVSGGSRSLEWGCERVGMGFGNRTFFIFRQNNAFLCQIFTYLKMHPVNREG